MEHRRSTPSALAASLGESLREIAVLVAVFAPLDTLIQGRSLTVRFAIVTIAIVVVAFSVGFLLEVKSWKR